MSKSASERINSLFEELDVVDNQLSKHFGGYELISNQMDDELCIQGNVAGLVHLARQVLYVAKSNVVGKHMHFDEYSDLTECNGKFIIGLMNTNDVSEETK